MNDAGEPLHSDEYYTKKIDGYTLAEWDAWDRAQGRKKKCLDQPLPAFLTLAKCGPLFTGGLCGCSYCLSLKYGVFA